MAPVGPWAQPKATRREGGRRAERPVGSYATPDTPCSRTAPKGLPQAEAWAERERVPSGHNCRRQLATGRPEQIQEPGTAVPGTPIFANNAQRGGPPLESPCRVLSLVLSFASKESTTPFGAAAPPSAPESARHAPAGKLFQTKLTYNAVSRGLPAHPLHPFGPVIAPGRLCPSGHRFIPPWQDFPSSAPKRNRGGRGSPSVCRPLK